MSNLETFDLLLVGFDNSLLEFIADAIDKMKVFKLQTAGEVERFLEDYKLAPGTTVFVSTNVLHMSHFEVAQAFSSSFLGLNLVFVTFDRNVFEVDKLRKNGFEESFLLPHDERILFDQIETVRINKLGVGQRKYKSVKLIDINPGQELPFEVRTFLPGNNKYVVLTASGRISEKKYDFLKGSYVNSVFIRSNQVEEFYKFTTEQLINSGMAAGEVVPQTIKFEKMQTIVRELFRSILDSTTRGGDFESGRDLLEQSEKVIENYVQKKTGINLAEKLKSLLGEGRDSYTHAQIVSTMSCLLSMATGIGKPEDLAIAGLFHDIGIFGIRDDISIFEMSTLSIEEQRLYKEHPRNSLNVLKEKKITLTPLVAEIISKHHERIDGNGFPEKLATHRIPLESQLLAYADAFEYLTRPKSNRTKPSLELIHQTIVDQLSLSHEVLHKVESFLKTL